MKEVYSDLFLFLPRLQGHFNGGAFVMMKSLLLFLILSMSWGAVQVKENHPRFDKTPSVLLISLDGYRHDYNDIYRPPTLTKFAQEGVRAKSLIPSFPSKTFPNHLSLVTGLYPGNHGIVSNNFYAPKLKKNYKLRDRDSLLNADFYSGIPLWNLASLNQMVSGVYFWPGSEAPIGGHLPSYYERYNHSTPHIKRINKIIEWLNLPRRRRPHYLSLYLSDVDSAGHRYGPRSKEVKEAVFKVDASLRFLFHKLSHLKEELNIIITSDHGMAPFDASKKVLIDKTPSLKKLMKSFQTRGQGSTMFLYYKGHPKEKIKTITKIMEQFSLSTAFYRAYLPSHFVAHFKGRYHPRMGDIMLVADPPTLLGKGGLSLGVPKGGHGYDGKHRDMQGIFFAKGPQFKRGHVVKSFENIHVYPLVAFLLGLPVEKVIDGDFNKVKNLLKTSKKAE